MKNDDRVWLDFLTDMKDRKYKVKIYLKEKNQITQTDRQTGVDIIKLNNIMLSGHLDDFDGASIRLKNHTCLIERSSIMSIKPE